MSAQQSLFDLRAARNGLRGYSSVLTVSENRKGVLDVDTVKGCTLGMRAYPQGGCYGECYAAKGAARYGIDFSTSVGRQFCDILHRSTIIKLMMTYPTTWYRVGTAGDPCHNWTHTIAILRELRWTRKTPVIITKHWRPLTEKQIGDLRWLSAVVNTSVSGLDTDAEISYRVAQLERLRAAGIRGVCRVVTCEYGSSAWATECKEKQNYLLSLTPVIDNPLRARRSNPRVLAGDIIITKRTDSIGGGKFVSLHDASTYLGICRDCPDQCGIDSATTNFWYEEDMCHSLPF
jgi:hypothetical protein